MHALIRIVKFRFFITSFALFINLIACSNDYTNLEKTPTPNSLLSSTPLPATPTPLPITSTKLPPVLTNTPLPSATPTERPVVTLYMPERWRSAANEAILSIDDQGTEWLWLVVDDESQAALRLVADGDGLFVSQRPLALTVPFTLNWEMVTTNEAEKLLSEGHPLVEVIEWSEMTPDRKALKVDGYRPGEEGYPIHETWSLSVTPGYESAAQELSAVLVEEIMRDPVIHLSAVGDVMLDRALGNAIVSGAVDFPFAKVTEELAQADITVGNLESALGDIGQPATKSYTFRAPPAAAESIANAGFDVISLANNHAMDYGPETLMQGIDLLTENGIQTIGAGINENAAHKATLLEVNGLTLALLGYVDVPVEVSGFDTQTWSATEETPGLAWAEPAKITMDVTEVGKQADLVIVVLHSGYEYVEPPSPTQMAAARAAIDAGADLVIGHHAHVLQGVEFDEGGVIVYGLGNFAFEIDGDPTTAILNVWLNQDGVRQLEFVPAIIQFGGQPRLAEAWEAGEILQRIYRLTAGLNIN